jgi:hypothetical protein
MAVISGVVTTYAVGVQMNSVNAVERTLRLLLPGGAEASIVFVKEQPDEWIIFWEDDFVRVYLPLRYFEDTVRLVQTETPLVFVAHAADEGPPSFLVDLTTFFDEEPGEGPADADAIV